MMQSSRLDRILYPALVLLPVISALFAFTSLDLLVQDRLYDFGTGQWLVDSRDHLGRLLFYQAPKALVMAIGLILLGLALGPGRWRRRLGLARPNLWVAVLTLVTLPLLVGLGKKFTGMHCPREVTRYGGSAPYVHLQLPVPEGSDPAQRGHCFPAGHASGGFALIALAWLRRSRRWRQGGILLGMTAGWWMGGYQILRGAHFLSHTLVTMMLAWIVVLAWRRCWRPQAVRVDEAKFIPADSSLPADAVR